MTASKVSSILKKKDEGSPDRPPQPSVVQMESSLGKLGRFPLLSVVGEGASGIVYRAIDPTLQRPVAVKAPRFVSNDPKQAERFLREARAVARLRHPNIAMVYDCGLDKNVFYIASEFIDGENFEQRLAKSPPNVRQSVEWVRDAARGLEYAHQKGIVHRDVKPANLMLSTDNRVVITDFGIARRMEETSTMTADGAVLGTPAYMSPEQARGDNAAVSALSDQYSLSVVLFELLTGRRPFEGSALQVLSDVVNKTPPLLTSLKRDTPADLQTICQRAMSKLPSNRYATIGDMADDLDRWLRGRPLEAARSIRRTPTPDLWLKPTIIAGAIIVTLLVIAFVMAGRGKPDAASTGDDARQKEQSPHANNPVVPKLVSALPMRPPLAVAVPMPPPEVAPPGAVGISPPVPSPEGANDAVLGLLNELLARGVWPVGTNSVGMKFQIIPPADFVRGAQPAEIEQVLQPAQQLPQWCEPHVRSEQPPHRATISRPFYLATTEVTRREFQLFVDDTKYRRDAERGGRSGMKIDESKLNENHPMTNVSWNDAWAFCGWLSRKDGRSYRLPTEAEWEWACRGPVAAINAAEALLQQVDANAWTQDNSDGLPHDQARSTKHPFGLINMQGNVWEWCADFMQVKDYAEGVFHDPKGPDQGTARRYRGGSWWQPPLMCRPTSRLGDDPRFSSADLGFRVASNVNDWLLKPDPTIERPQPSPVVWPEMIVEITEDTQLDPNQVYGSIVIKASNITIDGRGAWLVGDRHRPTNSFHRVAIQAEGVSNVTLKNVNVKGWETGLVVRDGDGWTIENCDFSDNFHDPDFGWGENGRRGGIALERVTKSTLRKNKANRNWDACVLVESNDNTLDDNDFSHTSNTCLKLWNASKNVVTQNVLSHGIRISPGEVHARDSTSVLIESGSNDNRFVGNDCTHGGDGIFVRVLNGWCSTGNLFEGNDCSYANNNGIECWAPRNVFVKNKANHCSYGFWLGGSDQTRLIGNEASFNGLADGFHNSPHLPDNGHAGIVFMFGPSSHTLVRGNVCRGNNGAGIALVGDLDSQGKKWKAYHWVIEQNTLEKNRWGIYAKHADWMTLIGNEYAENTVQNVLQDGDVTRFEERTERVDPAVAPPVARLTGPTSVKLGQSASWDALPPEEFTQSKQANDVKTLTFTWDVGDGRFHHGQELTHTFDRIGFHRIGLNISNGVRTDLAWRDVYVARDMTELGTERDAANWSIEDFHDRTRSDQQTSRAAFSDDITDNLIGQSALRIVIRPYAGFRAALTYPISRDAKWSMTGKTKLSFWLKAINEDVTGWQGGPFITLQGEGEQRCHIEPKPGLDLMRQAEHSEAREGWRLLEIPLRGNEQWQLDGDLPSEVRSLSLAVDSWGGPTLRFWIDGLAFE